MDQSSVITAVPAAAGAPAAPVVPVVVSTHAKYTLFLLMLGYAVHYIDRNILSVLMEPIKQDLGLSDSHLGFLTGFSFAMFYATLGVPIAMLADRSNRRNIIAVSLVVFSVFTAVCGSVTSFWQLVLARFGVGAGEAGTSPASHSIIADTFPTERRGGAMAVYALGANIGKIVALLGGGWLAHAYGWRIAMMVVAIPGLLLALVIRLTMREPLRGAADGKVQSKAKLKFKDAFAHLWGIRSFRHITIGVSLAASASYGLMTWAPSFLVRSFHLDVGQAGTVLAVAFGICGAIGTLSIGMLVDKLGKRDIRWYLWLIAAIQVLLFPFGLSVVLAPSMWLSIMLFAVPGALGSAYVASTLAMTQSLAPAPMRAFASSIYLLIVNLIGAGLGPLVIGMVSDVYRQAFGAESLRYALVTITPLWLWSAVHFALAGRTIGQDVTRAKDMQIADLARA